MTDFEKIELACDILENAEVMQEYDDCLWIKVDRQDWQAFFGTEEQESDNENE